MEEILLNSIASSGVTIPAGVSSVRDLTPSTLFAISSQSLHLIDRRNSSFPTSLPENSVPERLNLCSDLASSFKTLGFVGDISFHKFLYPLEEDLYELVRFLVGKLSDVETRKDAVGDSKRPHLKTPNQNLDSTGQLPRTELSGRLDHPLMITQTPESDQTMHEMEESYNGVQIPIEGRTDLCKETSGSEQDALDLVEDIKRSSLRESEHDFEYRQQSTSPSIRLPQMNCSTETLTDGKEMLMDKSVSRSGDFQELQEKLELLKAAAVMASDDGNPADFYTNQLSDQVEVKRGNIVVAESHWNDKRKALEEKKESLEETLRATELEAYVKYKKVEEIELELEFILAETKRREKELIALSEKSEKQPKLAPRRTYIERVEEITKNSRKQDADIGRILKETRELQLESNSIQERLNRTHAVVDETVFREAKKDHVGRQAYRTLASIHDSFEQIAENLLAMDRVRREVADYEGKLVTMASQNVDIDKLKADLDTIRRENNLIEKNLSKDLCSTRLKLI